MLFRVKGRWILAGLVLLAAACTGEANPPPEELRTSVAVDCPALPEGSTDLGFPLWPDSGALDLVPEMDSTCASPTSPYLFAQLNEHAAWGAGDLDAAALGVLHRNNRALATFTVLRVAEGVPGVEEAEAALAEVPAATEVGDLTVAWARSGDHVAAYWLDGREMVILAAEQDDAAEALTAWTGDASEPPTTIPEQQAMPPALEAGPPRAGLPEGYWALELDPIAILQADFADAVTIFEEETVSAIGAAVIVDEGAVVGTLVAGTGSPGIGSWPDEFDTDEIPAAGFTVGDTTAYVAGYDEEKVEDFVAAWKKALEKS